MKILSIAITLGLSLSVFGGHAVGLNSIENDSLPPIKVVERLDTNVAAPAEEAVRFSDKQQMVSRLLRFQKLLPNWKTVN